MDIINQSQKTLVFCSTQIEFKQIVGRGTRLFDGKDYYTIYDFVKAYEHFNDPEWDGDPEPCPECGELVCVCKKKSKDKIKLSNGKERVF